MASLGKLAKNIVSTSTFGMVGGQENNLLNGLSDTGSQKQQSLVDVGPAGTLEKRFTAEEAKLFDQLGIDISNLSGIQSKGASLADQIAALAGQPIEAQLTEADISAGKKLAEAFTAEESLGLQQSYEQQLAEANRLATRLGRSTVDPILQAQLRKTVMQQQQQLGAKKTSLSSQYALQNLQQRLGARESQVSLLSKALTGQEQQFGQNLKALQAQFSRATLAGDITGREQQFRLGAAGRTTTQNAKAGFLDVLGAGAGIAGSLAKLGA